MAVSGTTLALRQRMWRYTALLAAVWIVPMMAHANELERLYQLALANDATLQAASFERAADIEARPQALSQLLPQIAANATAARDRAGLESSSSLTSTLAASCSYSASRPLLRQCGAAAADAVADDLELRGVQPAEGSEPDRRCRRGHAALGAAESRVARRAGLLRVAGGVRSAGRQRGRTRGLRHAAARRRCAREQTGVGPRSDALQAQAFYDATDEAVIDARNALDDARLVLTEIVGTHAGDGVPLREAIPLASPEPATAEDWVASARQDNLDVRAAQLKADAAERDIAAARGRELPTLALVGASSRLNQDESLGGNQSLDSIGVAFSWPLFQGGLVASAVRQSRALYRRRQRAVRARAARRRAAGARGISRCDHRHSARWRRRTRGAIGSRRG